MVTINSFMDESGKFLDSEIVSFGAVVTLGQPLDAFVSEWAYLLNHSGLEVLETKEALRPFRPLSAKNEAMGSYKRIEAISPFVNCIKKHLSIVTGIAIDVKEFSALPEQYRQMWTDDPCYTGFVRTILEILEDAPSDGIIHLICDDEEKTAWPMYELYRRVKNQYPDARSKMKGIAFVDDKFSFGVQAADLVACLVRKEALFRFRNEDYAYKPLFDALTSQPEAGHNILKCGVIWCDAEQLTRLGESYKKSKKNDPVVQLSDLGQ